MANTETKSDFNVEVVRITDVKAHPNADRLEQYETTAGYPVLDTKGKYKVGDLAVYVPVDAIVPLSNPAFAFLRSKPEQETARIGARRLRGIYSEGLLISAEGLTRTGGPIQAGDNVQELLGITRYVNFFDERESKALRPRAPKPVKEMPVYGLDSLVRFKDAIPIGTPVVITEKIHGCNARYMFKDGRLFVGSHKVMRGDSGSPVKTIFTNAWRKARWNVNWLQRKLMRAIGLETAEERGGNLNAIQEKGDIWWQIADQYDLKTKLANYPGLTFYGEIYGKGLQVRGGVDFCYDSPEGLKFRVFDIWDASNCRFLSDYEVVEICTPLGLRLAPELYTGPWKGLEETVKHLNGPGIYTNLGGSPHIREGWVVRTDVSEADPNRKTFKWVSPEYKLLGEEKSKDIIKTMKALEGAGE
jgi:RNA ligase (TIGR02306 family)